MRQPRLLFVLIPRFRISSFHYFNIAHAEFQPQNPLKMINLNKCRKDVSYSFATAMLVTFLNTEYTTLSPLNMDLTYMFDVHHFI